MLSHGFLGTNYFPTCQVRVVRFYVSCPAFASPPASAGPQLPAVDRSGPHQAEANPGSERPTAPQQKTQDQSGPFRTSTASSTSQWPPPDPNSKPGSEWPYKSS